MGNIKQWLMALRQMPTLRAVKNECDNATMEGARMKSIDTKIRKPRLLLLGASLILVFLASTAQADEPYKCNNEMLTGSYHNVTVEKGATCTLLAGAKLTGSFKSQGAKSITINGTTIGSNHGVTIDGDVRATATDGDVRIIFANIGGDLEVNGTTENANIALVHSSRIAGNVNFVDNNPRKADSENRDHTQVRVGSVSNTPDKPAGSDLPAGGGNIIGGSVLFANNSGTLLLVNTNEVAGGIKMLNNVALKSTTGFPGVPRGLDGEVYMLCNDVAMDVIMANNFAGQGDVNIITNCHHYYFRTFNPLAFDVQDVKGSIGGNVSYLNNESVNPRGGVNGISDSCIKGDVKIVNSQDGEGNAFIYSYVGGKFINLHNEPLLLLTATPHDDVCSN